jgi:bacillopeptidase F (M6 metalloprotease family)
MSYIATSGILPVDRFKDFESWPSARWVKPGGAFAPHTGAMYAYSQIADVTYKRLTRTITVPAGGATLSFWTSYDTEPAWDFFFVEARTAGEQDWTTLPDLNGHTSTSTGDSCPEGWGELHPQLNHYQTLAGTSCTATGTTGTWNAASGNTGGWQQWSVDLSDYAGGQVEVSLAYVSDWAVQNLGAFVDDIVVSTGEGSTSFEGDLAGWTVSGAPAGSATNANDWIATDASGFPVGAAITTPHSMIMGFGVEGVTTPDARAALVGRVMDHLLP